MENNRKPFSLRNRLKSFGYAFNGLAQLIKNEHNFRIHLAVTFVVITAGIILGISLAEWLILILVITIVLLAESFNSAMEYICDLISPQKDERVKRIKDILAASVLIASIMAIIIGLLIFIPHILAFI